jgi:hypothetical protein
VNLRLVSGQVVVDEKADVLVYRQFFHDGPAHTHSHCSDHLAARCLRVKDAGCHGCAHAGQLVWAADTDAARNEAFNIVNGDLFRWNWLWPKLGEWFGVKAAGFEEAIQPLASAMANDHALWREIAQRDGLGRARPRPPGLGLAHGPRPGSAT